MWGERMPSSGIEGQFEAPFEGGPYGPEEEREGQDKS